MGLVSSDGRVLDPDSIPPYCYNWSGSVISIPIDSVPNQFKKQTCGWKVLFGLPAQRFLPSLNTSGYVRQPK